MTKTNSEAFWELIRHMSEALAYFYGGENMSESEVDDLLSDSEDVAGLLMLSLDVEVISVDENGKTTLTLSPANAVDFIKTFENKALVD